MKFFSTLGTSRPTQRPANIITQSPTIDIGMSTGVLMVLPARRSVALTKEAMLWFAAHPFHGVKSSASMTAP
ncbi:MAG: hypothetical protein LH616_17840 [Ilumatobacteraceae bacterium]|nr:hypothetical protein [Ilumatobacteraceae bacterium]